MSIVTLSAGHLARLLGSLDAPGPKYQVLADRIRLLVADGRISNGTRLPSERETASATGLSRTTVTRAYAHLRDSGLVQAKRGSGSVVAMSYSPATSRSVVTSTADPDAIQLTFSAPLGPPGLAQAFEHAAASLPGLLATTGYLPDGLPALRTALADRYTDEGLPTEPSQIIVTSGAMGAISLIARTLLRPRDRVVVEALSYPHAHDALRHAGAALRPLPIRESLWDPDALQAQLKAGGTKAAYLIADFHNPTSDVMTDDERGAWARLMRRHDVIAIADETLRHVHLTGPQLPDRFASFDPQAITVGSSSKEFWGGLRVGWIRAPHRLVMPLIQARLHDDLGTSAFDQLVLAHLITSGHDVAQAGRERLREGRDHLVAQLRQRLPEFEVEVPHGGLNAWVRLPAPISSALTSAAARVGLILTPGPRFFAQPTGQAEHYLRIPYAQPADVLTSAVERLHGAYQTLTGHAAAKTARPDQAPIDLIA